LWKSKTYTCSSKVTPVSKLICGSKFYISLTVHFYNPMFTNQRNALHFHFYYLYNNPYICFRLIQGHLQGVHKLRSLYIHTCSICHYN
jgi:hypothetical protein